MLIKHDDEGEQMHIEDYNLKVEKMVLKGYEKTGNISKT